MEEAINQAYISYKRGDYPIGACLVKDDKIIAVGSNKVKQEKDSTYHAEFEIMRTALKQQGGGYLQGCILYTTHEPCPMCSGACVWSKVDTIVYGNSISNFNSYTNEDNYFKWRVINVSTRNIVKDKVNVIGPYMENECSKLFYFGI